jgi:hypothetical protein
VSLAVAAERYLRRQVELALFEGAGRTSWTDTPTEAALDWIAGALVRGAGLDEALATSILDRRADALGARQPDRPRGRAPLRPSRAFSGCRVFVGCGPPTDRGVRVGSIVLKSTPSSAVLELDVEHPELSPDAAMKAVVLVDDRATVGGQADEVLALPFTLRDDHDNRYFSQATFPQWRQSGQTWCVIELAQPVHPEAKRLELRTPDGSTVSLLLVAAGQHRLVAHGRTPAQQWVLAHPASLEPAAAPAGRALQALVAVGALTEGDPVVERVRRQPAGPAGWSDLGLARQPGQALPTAAPARDRRPGAGRLTVAAYPLGLELPEPERGLALDALIVDQSGGVELRARNDWSKRAIWSSLASCAVEVRDDRGAVYGYTTEVTHAGFDEGTDLSLTLVPRPTAEVRWLDVTLSGSTLAVTARAEMS